MCPPPLKQKQKSLGTLSSNLGEGKVNQSFRSTTFIRTRACWKGKALKSSQRARHIACSQQLLFMFQISSTCSILRCVLPLLFVPERRAIHYLSCQVLWDTNLSEGRYLMHVLLLSKESYWIGLYNNNLTAVGWQWSNGDAFNYTHWKDKKMNSYSASVICVAMNNGLWFDGYCNQTYWFIFLPQMYYPINQLKNWSEARDYCRSHYTDLVSIRSPEEAKRTSQMIVSDRILWIGLFSKKGSTAEWMWTNGEEVNYTHWKFMQPNDYLNSDICVWSKETCPRFRPAWN
uniref:C-type lectin domain-containing protein n=1 Tax=Callorhinchus milii TaxID=7868 RepID=A0A4W3HN04_CALMI